MSYTDQSGPPRSATHRTQGVRLVVRASLRCSAHSSANRRRAQQLVCKWARAKWPRLVAGVVDMDRGTSECATPGQALSVLGEVGSSTWALSIATSEPGGRRVWMTEAKVVQAGDSDVMDVHTSCTDNADAPLNIAPPSLLRLWVRNLEFDDGGVPVIGEHRTVDDLQQAHAFCNHVQSHSRTLPIIALATSPGSNYYGVNPAHLAEAVSGLAHVACIGSFVLAEVAERLGPQLAPLAGTARIYEPLSDAPDPHGRHPLIRQSRRARTGSGDLGHLKRLLVQRACELSAASSGTLP
jgi:hypothetical protein